MRVPDQTLVLQQQKRDALAENMFGPPRSYLRQKVGEYQTAWIIARLHSAPKRSISQSKSCGVRPRSGERSYDPVGRATPSNGRRGTSLIEVGAAIALLATVMAMLVPVLSRTSGLREQVDRREVALGTVANLLERATLVPNPSPESLQPIAEQLSSESQLTQPEWQIVVTPESTPPMNRVEATLSWQARAEVRSSVKLVRWYAGGKL